MSVRAELPAHWIGLSSDLEVAAHGAAARRAGDAIAVHFPERRDFNDLNALWPVFTPAPQDLPVLLESWHQEFAGTGVRARILCWEEQGAQEPVDSPWADGDSRGAFRLSRLEVLRCTRPVSVPRPRELEFRAVETDADWRQVVELNVACHGYEDRIREDFCRWMIGERHRSACESGRARWWAAWRDGLPVGAMGLYEGRGGPERLQEVVTHPKQRRRGVCSALMSSLLERGGPEGFLLIADCGSEANRIYRRLGFEPVSRIRELFQRIPA